MVNSKKAVSLGLASMFSLYLLGAFIAEPARTLAATEDNEVSVSIASVLAFDCDTDQNAVIGPINGNGSATDDVTCDITTQNSAGYTLTWEINAGSGTANVNTGHLNSFTRSGSQPEAKIIPIATTDSTPVIGTSVFDDEALAVWGGRVNDDSTCSSGDTGCTTSKDFGTNGSPAYLRVATGALGVNEEAIAVRTTETDSDGDLMIIDFRVDIGSSTFLPTTTYKTIVHLTATDN